MKKKFGKQSKKILALFLVLVTVITMLPLSFIPAMAAERYGQTNSGQTHIKNGSSYRLKTDNIYYQGSNEIFNYNKQFAANPGWTVGNPIWTNVNQKYLTGSYNYGDHKPASHADVPLYRLARSGGYTVGDYTLDGVTTINMHDIDAFVQAANEDAVNGKATINVKSAHKIRKVLVNGFKQSNYTGGFNYNKEQLYFLATQCIIWEIQEDKRIGWGNDTHYRGTQTSNYPNNANNFNRSQTIKNSYNRKLPDSSKYYWHDFYYTVYYNQFQWRGFPDYYDEILKACAVMDEKLYYGYDHNISWGRLPSTQPTENDTWKLLYNNDTKQYERTFYVTPELVGKGYNMYNPDHIVLPLKEGIDTVKLKQTTNLRKIPTDDSENIGTVQGTPKVIGVTADGNWYLVTTGWGSFAKTGYVNFRDVDDWHKYQSDMKVTSSGKNGSKLTFSTPRVGDFSYVIRWDKNALTGFNEPNYFSGSGGEVGQQKNTARGYISGGNATEETVYLGLTTKQKTVKFYCGEEKGIFGNYQEIETITAPMGAEITIPQYHDHSKNNVRFKYWESNGLPTDLESGKKYKIDYLEDSYVAMYTPQYVHTYICSECGAVIDSFEGDYGKTYTVPQPNHIHKGDYIDKDSGKVYKFNELNMRFKTYSDNRGFRPDTPKAGETKTITNNNTYVAKYDFLNDIKITAFGLDEKDKNKWNASIINNISETKENYENGKFVSVTKLFKDCIHETIQRTFITPPEGYHISQIKIHDINGDNNKIISTNTTKGYDLTFYPDIKDGSNIEVYFEKNDVSKKINVHYVRAENICDYNDPTNFITKTKENNVSYGTVLNFKTDKMLDGEPYFYETIKHNRDVLSYCGEYGFNDGNKYKHNNNDSLAQFKDLTNFEICSDIDIYVYYKAGSQGGITVNVFAENCEENAIGKTTKDAIDFASSNSQMNVYYSDEQIDFNELYVFDESGSKVLNSKLKHFKDLTPELKPTINNKPGFDSTDYPYVSSYTFNPDNLINNKYYYFIINDNPVDNFYFSPEISGSELWSGFYQEYNIICSPGEYSQELHLFTQDSSGNKTPAKNATIIYMDYTEYFNLGLYNIFYIANLKQQYEDGLISKQEYDNKIGLTEYMPWTCPECNAERQRGTECSNCHYLNEGVSSAVHYAKTDENGVAKLKTKEATFVFNITNADFLTKDQTDNTINYSEREIITTISNDNIVQTLKNAGGELSDFWIDSTKNEQPSMGMSLIKPTVCTLSYIDHPYSFNIYSNESLNKIDYELVVKYKKNINDDYSYLETIQFNNNQNNNGEFNGVNYITGQFTSEKGNFKNLVKLNYQPSKIGYYDFEIKPKNNRNVYFAYDNITDVLYNGSAKEFNLALFKGNNKHDSVIDITFGSSGSNTFDVRVSDCNFINDFGISFDIYSKKTGGKIVSTISIPQSIIDKANEKIKYGTNNFEVVESYYDKKLNKDYTIKISKNGLNTHDLQTPDGFSGETDSMCQSNFRVSISIKDLVKNDYTAKMNYNVSSVYNVSDNIISEQTIDYKPVNGITNNIALSNKQNGVRIEASKFTESYIYKTVIDGKNNNVISQDYVQREDEVDLNFVNQQVFDISENNINQYKKKGYNYFTVEYYPSYTLNGVFEDGMYAPDEKYELLTYQEIIKKYSQKYGSVHDTTGSLDAKAHSIDNLNTLTLRHTAGIYKSDLGKYDFDAHLYIKLYKELPEQNTPDYTVDFIKPNANYKFGTTVVSSFMVNNLNSVEYKDSNPLNAKFNAAVKFTVNGSEKTMPVFTANKNLVLPGAKNNLLYFRWTIPTEDNLKDTIAKALNVSKDKIQISSFDVTATVTEPKNNYVKMDTGNVSVGNISNSTVQKSGYDLDGGKNFNYNAPDQNNKPYHNVAKWQEYICVNGQFKLIDNTAKLKFSTILLRPDEMTPTKAVAQNSIGEYQWLTRSGYAVRTEVKTKSLVDSTNEEIINSSCTPAQTSEVYYPEFNYTNAYGKYEPLVLDIAANMFKFKDVENAEKIRSRHYIPVWYPDGNYITQVYVSDMWTPAGMLDYAGESNPVGIKGSLFDDYRTQHKDF